MAIVLQRALDVSNYSGAFSAETARRWREAGVEHVICGTQRPDVTRAQALAVIGAGLTLDAYVYLYWSHDVIGQVRDAIAVVEGLPVGCLWLDCEDGVAGRAATEVGRLIESAVGGAGDFPVGVYTGRWWWQPATGDSAAFAHLPLWHAEYTSSPALLPDFDSFQPYGGWQRPLVWQYRGSTTLAGVTVDLNLREVAPVQSAGLPDGERIELTLLRSAARLQKARWSGRYIFRPAADAGSIEVQRLAGDCGVSFEPPLFIPVD